MPGCTKASGTVAAAGIISPPPKPWSTRKAISISADVARPQSPDPTQKQVTDTSHTRRDPKRSESQPAT